MCVVPFLARSTLKLERGGVWQQSSHTTSEGDDKASDCSGRRSLPKGPWPSSAFSRNPERALLRPCLPEVLNC